MYTNIYNTLTKSLENLQNGVNKKYLELYPIISDSQKVEFKNITNKQGNLFVSYFINDIFYPATARFENLPLEIQTQIVDAIDNNDFVFTDFTENDIKFLNAMRDAVSPIIDKNLINDSQRMVSYTSGLNIKQKIGKKNV